MNLKGVGFIRYCLLTSLCIGYLMLWMGGIYSHLFRGAPPADMDWTTPLFLLLAGAIVLTSSRRSEITFLLLGGMIGFMAEVAGVYSGWVFGSYWYTDALRPQLFGVPLAMIPAWLVLIGYVRQMLIGWKVPAWLSVLCASAWLTAIDLIIDPLSAGVLGHWRWQEQGFYYGIPAHNFAGWFGVSLVIFSLLRGPVVRNVWAERTGLSIVLFFTLLAWIHGLLLATLFGVVLSLLHFLVRGNRRETL